MGKQKLGNGLCALIVMAALSVAACGGVHTTRASTGVTCDEYSQQPLVAARVGGQSQSSVILDMIEARDMAWNVQLVNRVQSAVDKFCGKPSPQGASKAKRNSDKPISDAVDWQHLS